MEYQDEVTVEQIMKMGLEEAYENLCIIEDDIEGMMSERGQSADMEDVRKKINLVRRVS